MSEIGGGLQQTSNGGEVDPFEAPVLASYSFVEHTHQRKQMKDVRMAAYLLVILAIGATFIDKAEVFAYGLGCFALLFWAIYRIMARTIKDDERYHFTQTHFLIVSRKRRQAHELARLEAISINGAETDDENRYRIDFEDGQRYTMVCGGPGTKFAEALSAATQVPITMRDDSIKIALPRRKR